MGDLGLSLRPMILTLHFLAYFISSMVLRGYLGKAMTNIKVDFLLPLMESISFQDKEVSIKTFSRIFFRR